MGGASLLVDVLLFTPILLSNVPLALMIVLLAFAYLGDDVLLCIALLIIVGLLIAAGMIWQSMSAAGWVRAVLDRTCRRAPRNSRAASPAVCRHRRNRVVAFPNQPAGHSRVRSRAAQDAADRSGGC